MITKTSLNKTSISGKYDLLIFRWALLFWMLHEDIQVKIRREIDAELGRDQLPSVNDRVRLPYTDAFLMEVQRLGNIVPNGVAHSNLENLEIGGMSFHLSLYCFVLLLIEIKLEILVVKMIHDQMSVRSQLYRTRTRVSWITAS